MLFIYGATERVGMPDREPNVLPSLGTAGSFVSLMDVPVNVCGLPDYNPLNFNSLYI